MSHETPASLESEIAIRRQEAADYDKVVASSQERREAHTQAALVSAATFLTLMSASVTGNVDPSQRGHLLAAQFLLCVLFGGAFAYYLNAMYHHALRIADAAACRLELEERGGITEIEGLRYKHGPRTWRLRSQRSARFLAFIPRYGQSQRDAALFLPVVGLLPAAWFALADNSTPIEDAAIVLLTVLLGLFVVRQLFAGCRHWVWVHPKRLIRTRSAFDNPVRTFGWWKELQTQELPKSGPDRVGGS